MSGQQTKLFDVKKFTLNKNIDNNMETDTNTDNTDTDEFQQTRKTAKINHKDGNKIVVVKKRFQQVNKHNNNNNKLQQNEHGYPQ